MKEEGANSTLGVAGVKKKHVCRVDRGAKEEGGEEREKRFTCIWLQQLHTPFEARRQSRNGFAVEEVVVITVKRGWERGKMDYFLSLRGGKT